MLFLAYDGSTHGDWLSHYAARLAANHGEKRLQIIHVCDRQMGLDLLAEKVNRIRVECERLGVAFQFRNEPLAGTIFETIQSVITTGPDTFLICGTRVQQGRRGLLSGTVSEKLLQHSLCNVLAVRVVQPGLLGCPRRFLVPVSGHPRGFRSGLSFLKLFGPDVMQMHILFIRRVAWWRLTMLSRGSADQLREPGERYVGRVEQEICTHLGLRPALVDANAILSDDVPGEIVNAAGKAKSHLIYMGATERNFAQRCISGNPIERVLRDATCDVAIYRGVH